MDPVVNYPASGRLPSSDLGTGEMGSESDKGRLDDIVLHGGSVGSVLQPARAVQDTAMEEEGICSAGGDDTLMADGELRHGGVEGMQGSLLCLVGVDGMHVPGACSVDSFNGVVKNDCMAQGKVLGRSMQGGELILDIASASGEIHDGPNSVLMKASGISSIAGVSGVSPHLPCEDACMDFVNGSKVDAHVDNMHVFSAMRPVGNDANLHDLSSAGHPFKMGSRSSSYARQNLFSSKLSSLCTPGVYPFAQDKIKVQNSKTAGSMGISHAADFKLKDLGNGGDPKLSCSPNAHHSVNAWSRPPVVSLPKISNSGSFLFDENNVRLDEDALHAIYKQFEGALIGRFGKPLAFFHLNAELKRRWEHFGSFRLVMTNASRFICFFDCVEARDNVMMGGPWVIAGQVLSINNWSASFINSPKDELITPIWVRLPGLPFHCWDSQNLTHITTPIGEPLWIDSATALLNRGSFARVCIKMDLSKPVKAGIWVHISQGKFFQPVEYEGLPVLCFGCGIVGHKVADCKMGSKESWANKVKPNNVHAGGAAASLGGSVRGAVNVQAGASSENADGKIQSAIEDPDSSKGLGPWTVVSRRRRPPHKESNAKLQHSYKGGNTLKTKNSIYVDKRQHQPSLSPPLGAAGGHLVAIASARVDHLQGPAVGGMLNISADRSLSPSYSHKNLDSKVFGFSQQQGAGWTDNQQDMKVLHVHDSVGTGVLLADAG